MGGRVFRASVGTILLVSLLWFLSICILSNHATTEKAATTINLNVLTFIGSKQHPLHRRPRRNASPNLHSVSKRRVPNGPDPIHNRRARNSREPPTRA